jgi:RHS repeat-associated protein
VGDSAGRHLYTRDALTGGIRYRFAYDAAGRLASVRDGAGLVTQIQRDGAGAPSAIVGPFGHVTGLAVDGNGHLSEIRAPLADPIELSSSSDGLLETYSDALGNLHVFQYGDDGRLSLDQAPTATGMQTRLSAPIYQGPKRTVEVTSGEGRVTRYAVASLLNGTLQREVVDPAGLAALVSDSTDAATRSWLPSGVSETDSLCPDDRFGMNAPFVKLQRIRLPSGLTKTVETTRSRSAGFDPPAVKGTWSEAVSVNSRPASSLSFNSDSLLMQFTSPAGRVATMFVDSVGRPLTFLIPGLSEVQFAYDNSGRVIRVSQGGRGQRFGYDALGRLATTRDTLGRMVSRTYLADDRPTQVRLPGNRVISLDYDDEWNLRSLTPPGRPAHRFEYNPANLVSRYIAPDVGGPDTTEYRYDRDGVLTERREPGGDDVLSTYNATTGRLESVTIPRGTSDITYLSTGQVHTIGSPDSVTVTRAYDGPIDTMETWSGRVAGSVSVALDRAFRVSSQRINGTSTVSYDYDDDGLMTRAGDLTITRRQDNGLVAGTSLGGVTTVDSYSHVGELWKRTVTYGGQTLYEATWDRDSLGRIVGLVENVQGTPRTVTYGYGNPDTGFVSAVTTNGVTEHYAYDGNGNRLAYCSGSDTSTATYDAQDRLLRYGSKRYTYTAAGRLAAAIADGDTTTYSYDALGNLIQVRLPQGGPVIAYRVDGLGRRVARLCNGVVTNRWLYGDELRPMAEVDSVGNVLTRYVYGTSSNIPEYMVRAGVTYRIVSDQIGSVRLVVNTVDGTVAQRLSYDVFGRVIEDTSPGFQSHSFAGGLSDSATGLVRFGARDYDPCAGRWTGADPLLYRGRSTNLYGYVQNDPANWIDPEGTAQGNTFGLPRKFWNWYHRDPNAGKQPGDPDLTHDQAMDKYREWCDLRKRGRGGREKESPWPRSLFPLGEVDIFEIIVPIVPAFINSDVMPMPLWMPKQNRKA